MSDDDDTDDVEAPWLLLLRRTFGVPDVVGERAARELIGVKVTGPVVTAPWVTLEQQRQQVSPLIDAIVRLGAEGELDGLFTGSESFDSVSIAHSIAQDLYAGLHGEQARAERARALATTAGEVLEALRLFVERHPFQDQAGRYFSLPPEEPLTPGG